MVDNLDTLQLVICHMDLFIVQIILSHCMSDMVRLQPYLLGWDQHTCSKGGTNHCTRVNPSSSPLPLECAIDTDTKEIARTVLFVRVCG